MNLLTKQKNKEDKVHNHLRFILYKLMRNANVTQSELSRILDIPYATLNKILKNEDVSPRIETLRPIAKYFKVTVDQLIGDTPLGTSTIENSTQKSDTGVPGQWEFIEWRSELFINCINEVTKILNQKKQIISLDQALQISKEIYLYFLTKNEEKVDKDFVLWAIEHTI